MANDNISLIKDFFIELLGFEPEMLIEESNEEIQVGLQVEPDVSGVLIGYRGEVITALQTVLSLMIQTKGGEYFPVRLNVNNYKEQRSKALEGLAQSSAEKAISLGREIEISNLSSYERRIIHSYLGDNPEVETFSRGVGSGRVLVVSPSK